MFIKFSKACYHTFLVSNNFVRKLNKIDILKSIFKILNKNYIILYTFQITV